MKWRSAPGRQPLSDEECIAAYRDHGDLAILASLFDRYVELIFGVCLKYMKSPEESEDATMEIFEVLRTKLRSHQIESFRSWLYIVTKNHCLQILRKRNPVTLTDDYDKLDMHSGASMHLDDEEREFAMLIRENGLQVCLDKLPSDQKQVVELFYYESKTYQEIADFLSLDKEHVRSRLQNGRRNLRICIDRNDRGRKKSVMESMSVDQYRDIMKLLRKLRSGDLSREEWARLDSLTASDPMLFDAVEGLKQIPADVRTKHIQNLLSRLGTQKTRPLVIAWIPTWARVAASVLLLAGLGWFIMRTLDDTEQRQVAESMSQPVSDSAVATPLFDEDSRIDNMTAPSAASHTLAQSEPSATPEFSTSGSSTLTYPQPHGADPIEERTSPASPDHETVVLTDPAGDHRDENESADRSRILSRSEPDDIKLLSSGLEELMVPEVRGVVMNYIGEPLIGAQIQVKGTLAQTETDNHGAFALAIPNRNYRNALVISHQDYPAIETEVADGDSIIVKLQESIPAGTSSITTLSQKRMTKSDKLDSKSLSKPTTGDRSFQKYLKQNLKYPETAAQSNIHGSVVVEFDVSSSGVPINLRITKSLGYGCDDEAIRLILEGPTWTNSESGIGRCEIEF